MILSKLYVSAKLNYSESLLQVYSRRHNYQTSHYTTSESFK